MKKRNILKIPTLILAILAVIFGYLDFKKIQAYVSNQPFSYCRSGQLIAAANWEGATGALAGTIKITNKNLHPCILDSTPEISIRNQEGISMPVSQIKMQCKIPQPVILKYKTASNVFFVWRNWCVEKSSEPINLFIKLPHNGEIVIAPAIDSNGKPLSDYPRCDNPESSSTISVSPFLQNQKTCDLVFLQKYAGRE